MNLAKTSLQLFVISSIFNAVVFANEQALWQDQHDSNSSGLAAKAAGNSRGVDNARLLTLDTDAMKLLLASGLSNGNIQARTSNMPSIELPLPDGSNVTLSLESTNILPTSLASKYPDIRTYKVAYPSGDIISGRVDFTELGFHAMLQTFDGQTLFIDPASKEETSNYLSYRKVDHVSANPFQCSTPEEHDHTAMSPFQSRTAARTRSNEGILEYRIAIATTAEYTQLQGGTVSTALSSIVTTLNRVNHIYEQSLGIRLSLVANNDQLIFTDAGTDPYSNYNIATMLSDNQSTIDRVIGSSNYDIGHVFGTSGGGLAYIGSVCSANSKARGASGIRNPNNDSFDVEYVAHEIGHQFGATHTFNSNQGICTSGARTASSAFEPGSGSSIMSYVGGCGTDDLQTSADAMFHSGSIEQINKNVLSGTASSCGTLHQTTNNAPLAIAGSSFTIPAHTPFELNGKAIDAENDTLQYSWEQIDTGSASALKVDTGNNPLFRILPLTSDSSRSFPANSTLLGTHFVKGETLPSTNRTMNFQLAVYDGHHAPSLDRIAINVSNSGESFSLQAPASAYGRGDNINVQWNTANTENAPVSCPLVDIHLSTDGGNNFNVVLAEGIPNNGAASIYLPETANLTNEARFKLSCGNNIFFSISSSSFAISQNVQSTSAGPRNSESASLAEDTSSGGGGSTSALLMLLLITTLVRRKRSEH